LGKDLVGVGEHFARRGAMNLGSHADRLKRGGFLFFWAGNGAQRDANKEENVHGIFQHG
jgi:hypothetical protein